MNCPVCGSTDYREAKMCSKIGQAVCMDCCRGCEHGWKDDLYLVWRCRHGVEEAEKAKGEIGRLRKKIEILDKQQADLYRRGYQYKAEDVVWEIVELKRRLEALVGA